LGGFLGLRGNSKFKQSIKSFKSPQITVQTKNDIIKADGGELRVETKEGEGSEFIIYLPIT
jgi:lipopolysaccharide export system protein LptA